MTFSKTTDPSANSRCFSLCLLIVITSFSALARCNETDQPKSFQIVNPQFAITVDSESGSILQIERPGDPVHLEFLQPRPLPVQPSQLPNMGLGDLLIHYRFEDGWISPLSWRTETTYQPHMTHRFSRDDKSTLTVEYPNSDVAVGEEVPLAITETYRPTSSGLRWELKVRNLTQHVVEVGDLALPLPFHTRFKRESDPAEIYTHYVIRHAQIAGANSSIFWMRPDGVGPFLLMTPEPGTTLEYYGNQPEGADGTFMVYIHGLAEARDLEPRGTWNQPLSDVKLAKAGSANAAVSYAFEFEWADSYQAVRNIKVAKGQLDIEVLPGMVIPEDLAGFASIRSNSKIDSVEAEYPRETRIQALPSPQPGRNLYRLKFSHLGENNITIRWGGDRTTALEYFVTEPLPVLVKKRAAHIIRQQQVRDPSKWYNGEFSLWDMEQQKLRTPDDTAGLDPYMVGGSDDPDLSKAPFVAEKNISYPNDQEIAAIEYYIQEFVWGKLQRTDKEQRDPYGVYGIPNWKASRESNINAGGLGRQRMWRSYDYPHLIQLYLAMYRIGRLYPEKLHYLNAEGYLDRAFGTAKAYFEVPYSIIMDKSLGFPGYNDWSYKLGTMHESHIEELIDVLRGDGRAQDADWLQGEWEKKVKYFAYDSAYPFGSEMFFDTTAFQSAYAFARYGLTHDLHPDENLWQDKNTGHWYSHPHVDKADFTSMMKRTIAADIAARGWIETTYYQMGSDYRGSGLRGFLTYMSQMGGYPILDYGLEYAQDPYPYIRLGYASQLSSWALMNTGNDSTGFGYWYPGRLNDGAAGWAFLAEKYGESVYGTNIRQGRGAWRYDGEIDNGYSEALAVASTVVVSDPMFGLAAYGGIVEHQGDDLRVWPHDELGQRIWIHTDNLRLYVALSRDGFDRKTPVMISDDASKLQWDIENRDGSSHLTSVSIRGLSVGQYRISSTSGTSLLKVLDPQAINLLSVRVGASGTTRIVIERTR